MDWDLAMSIVWKIVAVLFLVLLNGFFVAAEFSLVKVRDTQLMPLIQKGNRRARAAQFIIERLDSFLSAAQLGITLASLGLGWIGEPVFSALLHPVFGWLHMDTPAHADMRHFISVAFGFSTITFLHISAGEQAPKWLAIQNALPTSLWVAYPMMWFYWASYPFVWVLNHSSQWMLRRVGLNPSSEMEGVHSEEELRLLIGARNQPGNLAFRRRLVLNALDLPQRTVREIMRPRQEITVLDTEASIADCLDVAEKSRYSRFPLTEGGDLDKTLGVVHIKDLYAMRIRARSGADLRPAMRKLIYVPETGRLEKLLQMFLERKSHLAIVVDEYGGTMGLVTLENILEELVGQIQDEFDQETPELVRISEGAWDAAGTLSLHELEQLLGESLHGEGVTTASGFITERLGGFPKMGDVLKVGAYELKVEEMHGTRVGRLRITRLPEVQESAGEI